MRKLIPFIKREGIITKTYKIKTDKIKAEEIK